jgi:Cu-Zn family superoxide dismutase
LGNISVEKDNDEIYFEINNNELLSLNGEYSILGRSVIIHEDEDDLGKGNHKDSLITGNSGKRIACGVIGICRKDILEEII